MIEALIAHPKVRRINFTGSTRVGRIIAQTAASYLKPVLLELGGKAPLIVLDDADIDEAVNAAAFGAFMNPGQICMSTEKIVLDNTVADAFLAKFAARRRAAGRRPARPRRRSAPASASKPPPRIAASSRTRSKGARVVAGGEVDAR